MQKQPNFRVMEIDENFCEEANSMAGDAAAARCELCDLPTALCVHGQPRSRAGAGKKSAARQEVKLSSGKAKRTPTSSTPAKPKKCANCAKRARYGRYRLCLPCGKAAGFRLCSKCGRYFQPGPAATGKDAARKKAICTSCHRGRPRRSVWAPASAGSPGLGRRA